MNSKYDLKLHRKAVKSLEKIVSTDLKLARQIKEALLLLEKDPFQGKKLTGDWKDFYKYRVRDYRIIYQIIDDKLVVFVLEIVQLQCL